MESGAAGSDVCVEVGDDMLSDEVWEVFCPFR